MNASIFKTMGKNKKVLTIQKHQHRRPETIGILIDEAWMSSNVRVLEYRDKDTLDMIILVPSLTLKATGATREEAMAKLLLAAEEYWFGLLSMPPGETTRQLARLGWGITGIRKQEFAKAYTDISSTFKNLNALDGIVTERMITI